MGLPDGGQLFRADGGYVFADGGIGYGAPAINEYPASPSPCFPRTTRPGGPSFRTFRTRDARYPVGGIKQTVDGVIRVDPSDFIPTCYVPPAVDGGIPDAG